MEERIIELETRLAFQEEGIQTLNQALHDQQQLIDELQRELHELRERFKAFSTSPLEAGDIEPPPPHY